jgi:MFS family permease
MGRRSLPSHLHEYVQAGMIKTPSLTITGLAVAFARLSDVYGRKTMVMTAWILFTAFSIGCGVSQSMVQLLVSLPPVDHSY